MSAFMQCSRLQIARAIDVTCQWDGHAKAELLRAVYSGNLALAEVVDRTAKLDAKFLRKPKRPLLVVIGDDDGQPTGPNGWRAARLACSWAKAAIVHGAAAEPEHYRLAAEAAVTTGRGLLIETSSEHVEAWAALVRGKPVLRIVPSGGAHPLLIVRDALQ